MWHGNYLPAIPAHDVVGLRRRRSEHRRTRPLRQPAWQRCCTNDISEKRPEFRELYDVIILFDVVEHIEPTRPFLQAALFHLKPGGVVLVNVPALQGLFSVYDTVAGHYRRYTLDTLAAEFASFDVSVVDRVYWGFSMVPLLWLRKQVLRRQTDEKRRPTSHRIRSAVACRARAPEGWHEDRDGGPEAPADRVVGHDGGSPAVLTPSWAIDQEGE